MSITGALCEGKSYWEKPTESPCKAGERWGKGGHRQRKPTQSPCKAGEGWGKGGQRVGIVRESPPKARAKRVKGGERVDKGWTKRRSLPYRLHKKKPPVERGLHYHSLICCPIELAMLLSSSGVYSLVCVFQTAPNPSPSP